MCPEYNPEVPAAVQYHATALPWGLLRDPKTDTALALGAHSFVRALPTPAQPPIALFSAPADDGKLEIRLEESQITDRGGLDPALPSTPDAGFCGRDETLLALDRAFDRHQIVLLHAYAGSGKTATSPGAVPGTLVKGFQRAG